CQSSVHLPEHDVDAAENYDHVGDRMADAHIFENRQVDEAGRTHAIAVRVRRAVANYIKAEFTLGRFDAAVGFADLRPEVAKLGLGINDRPFGNVFERLLQNFQRFAHFQNTDHVAVVNVAVLTDRHAKFEAVIDAVFLHFADIVVHAAGTQHGTGDA